ncbi:MAG: Rv2175c family DNA-binding protein [Beutenbergiaceae bacterium]
MSTDEPPLDELTRWLSIPEAAQALGVRDRDIRSMVAEQTLLALRIGGGGPQIPASLLVPDPESDRFQVVPGLRGTVIQLLDAGFSDVEIVRWLLRPNDELDATPAQALAQLRTHAVRRSAQALAF